MTQGKPSDIDISRRWSSSSCSSAASSSSSTASSSSSADSNSNSNSNSITHTFQLPKESFKFHLLGDEQRPNMEVQLTKEDAMRYYKEMVTMRRMEITADMEYKNRSIRGFLHLYDGQEAVATGTEAALTRDDDWITSYRCHCTAVARGVKVEQVFAELFGFEQGAARGKGGSMHLYKKSNNFYGGAAIVGAQIPVGAGLAFYHHYKQALLKKTDPEAAKKPTNISIVMYGDGAVNQGQAWEAANMAALWKLPVLFIIENNEYGMGTSTERSSALTEYYKQGNIVIPGIQVNGMDVLAVREAMRFAKEHAANGKGPMFLEMKTYRYHGHSMSDPGIAYRSRDEVSEVRAKRDPIEGLKAKLIEAGFATDDELKDVDKEMRKHVQDSLQQAKKGTPPNFHELYADIYTTGKALPGTDGRLEPELPPIVRMPDSEKTIRNSK